MVPPVDQVFSRGAANATVTTVAVDGGCIVVETSGNATGTLPIVFVHGWALDRRIWKPQVAEFASSYRVVTYDRRGYGRSTAPADLSREVDDLIAVIDVVGARKTVIVGMSQGVRIAVEAAIREPHRVVGLTLLGAPPVRNTGPDDDVHAPPLERLGTAASRADRVRLLREHPLFALPGGAGAWLRDAVLADYRGDDLASRPVATFDSAEHLPDDLPTLYVNGDQDSPARIASAQLLANTKPATEFALLAGAGHLANLCSPLLFNAVLSEFLSRFRA